jgi:hypothetical protein
MRKVVVGGRQDQFVPEAELCQQRADLAKLNPAATTGTAQGRSIDVIVTVGAGEPLGGRSLGKGPCPRAGC